MELQQLLRECKRNGAAAQKCLYEQFATSMFLLCRRYLRTDEAAEEAMMNGFLKFFHGLDRFQYVSDAATVGWLRRIMVNECLMQLRSTNSFLQVAAELPEVADAGDPLDGLSAEEIFRLITGLPIGYRTVFNLYVMEGLGHKEIAKELGITEGTSKSQLSKARQLLQQQLIQQNSDHAWRKTKG
jgi:RNA polymerase sigma factor (sigma-70 family)